MNATLEKIAAEILDLDTLDTRNSDRLDFSEQAVWTLKAALEAAYIAGMKAGRKTTRVPLRGCLWPDGAESLGAVL